MKHLIPAILLLIICSSPLRSEDDDNRKTTGDDKTDKQMVELQKKSKGLKTCTAHVSTLIRIEDQEVTIAGPGMFMGPGKMRIEKSLPDGSAQLVINDGSYLWIHDKTENMVSRINLARVYQVTKIEADTDQFDPLRPFRGVDWKTIRYTGKDTIAGIPHAGFDATPMPTLLFAQLPSPPAKVKLSVHLVDGLLRRARIYDEEGIEIIVQEFSDVQGNRELDKKQFEFIVPAGAHPMDATSETIEFFKSIQ
jgi:outer membrane lipoprotein-sorting protein